MNYQRINIFISLCLIMIFSNQISADTFQVKDSTLIVMTDRYEIQFERGAIISIKNKLTGESYTKPNSQFVKDLAALPSGAILQPVKPTPAEFKTLSQIHGWEGTYKCVKGAVPFTRYVSPTAKLKLTEVTANSARIEWQGSVELSTGKTFQDDKLVLNLKINPDSGELEIDQKFVSNDKGVVGIGFSMLNFSRDLTFIIPLFNGFAFTGHDISKMTRVMHWPQPFLASIIMAQGKKGTVAMWMADPYFGDRYIHLKNDDTTMSFNFESVNPAPFSNYRQAVSRPIRINVFKGNWVKAARPYRDWWEKTHKVGKIKDRKPAWIKDIFWFSSFGRYTPPSDIGKNCVYFAPQSWKKAPKIGDGGLFPYDIEKGPELARLNPDLIGKLRQVGTHILVYMNINHMNAGHPWTKKFWPARLKKPFDLSTIEHDPKFQSKSSFKVNTAFKPWQDTQIWWAKLADKRFKIKGYYMDCAAGTPNTSGMRPDGKNDCIGQVDLMKRLKKIPESFLNVEYLTEVTATATDFAYLGYDGWFASGSKYDNTGFRGWRWRAKHVHPIVGFLFNPYVITTMHSRGNPSDTFDEVMGRIPKTSFGPLPPGTITDYSLVTPFPEFLTRLLCRTEMRPVYPERWEQNVKAYYKDPQKNTYRVISEIPPEGRMEKTTPDGKKSLVYWRIMGRSEARIDPDTGIEGWIAYQGKDNAIGLDPQHAYLYYANPAIKDWRITSLPKDTVISDQRLDKNGGLFLDLRILDGKPAKGNITIKSVFDIKTCVNGIHGNIPFKSDKVDDFYSVTVPVSVPGSVALTSEPPFKIRFPDNRDSFDFASLPVKHYCNQNRSRIREPILKRLNAHSHPGKYIAFKPNYKSIGTIDYVVDLPEIQKGKKLLLTFSVTLPEHANNSAILHISANGREVFKQKFTGKKPPVDCVIDLTDFAGKTTHLKIQADLGMLFAFMRLNNPTLKSE